MSTPAAQEAAEAFEKALRNAGTQQGCDTFKALLSDMLKSLIVGYSLNEIYWGPGGSLLGFGSINSRDIDFLNSFTPHIRLSNARGSIEPEANKFIYAHCRMHGSDPARGGLIRPLAWLHCFKSLNEKDLLSFIERYGMPFIAGMVDPATFDKEKNTLKRLILNFGSSGGGVFTKNVELKLLECTGRGEAFFQLLQYLEAAVNKVILGQTASSGESAGLSKGDAQSKVRQDILEVDCRTLQRVINTQLIKPWTRYNCGEVAPPQLVIDCAAPEDEVSRANVLKTLYEAGFEADAEEVSARFGCKLKRRTPDNPAMPPVQSMGAEAPDESPVEKWLGPVARKIDALTAEDLSDDDFRKKLTELASDAGFGDSGDFEDLLQNIICAGITAGYEKNRRKRR